MPAPSQPFLSPAQAISTVEPGRWGVAVSGGADSVALLRLAAADGRLALHVIHLDHQTRGDASTADADFVARLAADLRLPATIGVRSAIEPALADLPANPSARYRAVRLALYRRVCSEQSLRGVLLAHHADDQAETVLLRLLRGGGYPALAGMTGTAHIAEVTLRRPLLRARRSALRDHLQAIGQSWREDASNAEADYARNRVRVALAGREDLTQSLLAVADRCRALSAWVEAVAPTLADGFPVRELGDRPAIVAQAAVAGWLLRQGVPGRDLSPAQVEAVVQMCQDAATPSRLTLPGNVTISRRGGMLRAKTGHPGDAPP